MLSTYIDIWVLTPLDEPRQLANSQSLSISGTTPWPIAWRVYVSDSFTSKRGPALQGSFFFTPLLFIGLFYFILIFAVATTPHSRMGDK